MTITNFVPSELDAQFKEYSNRIQQLYEQYESIYDKVSKLNAPTLYFKFGTERKQCLTKYIEQQKSLLVLDLNVPNLQTEFIRSLYGLTNTRITSDSDVSISCQFLAHKVNFDKAIPIVKTYESGVHKAICNRPNTFYVVNGNQLTVTVNNKTYMGEAFEFVTIPELETIVVSSNEDFEIYQYELEEYGDTVSVYSNAEGFVEFSFKSYINQPIKFWINSELPKIVIPTENNVYKVKTVVSQGDTLNFQFVISNQEDKQFDGIIRCIRWWNL